MDFDEMRRALIRAQLSEVADLIEQLRTRIAEMEAECRRLERLYANA